jgi:hypothetical protein
MAARSGCEGIAELLGGIGAERWARGKLMASMVARSGLLSGCAVGLLTRSTQRPAAWLRQWLPREKSSWGRLRLRGRKLLRGSGIGKTEDFRSKSP